MGESVAELGRGLARLGAGLRVRRGRPAEVIPALARETGASHVYVTRDASPYGRARDRAVAAALAAMGVGMHARTGLYVHEPDEVRSRDGGPFSVYGAFRRAWGTLDRRDLLPVPDRVPGLPGSARDTRTEGGMLDGDARLLLDLPAPSADRALLPMPGEAAARGRLERWLADRIDGYAGARDRLDVDGTSRISQDLRWGLLSPLEVVARAEGEGEGRRVFVNEIAWREFYAHVLWHHPRVVREPFQRDLVSLEWRDDPTALEAWREGRTGYPVVDAAMRQLRASGFVANRARMIAASFLAKHLLLDWRHGEAEFMRHLVDGDLASNNGGWQWTASTGTDPQPYFRVFNPILQGRRHDPGGEYVRRWVPELRGVRDEAIHEPWTMSEPAQAAAGCRIGTDYPAPIVDHGFARARALAAYAAAKAGSRAAAAS
jgi:deoxyribodipyrimidine photo-lyase